MGRILKLAATALGAVLYLWVAAVHHLPRVRGRKARRRRPGSS